MDRKGARPRENHGGVAAMKKFLLPCFLLLTIPGFSKTKPDLIDLAKYYYERGNYHSSITELMRFQHLYPNDKRIPESLFLMGKAYYRGKNPRKARMIFQKCYYTYPESIYGGKGLYSSGVIRLLHGSPLLALRDFREYCHVYPKGELAEDAFFNSCTSCIIAEKYKRATQCHGRYRHLFPLGKYTSVIDERMAELKEIEKRGKKSPLIAGLSSAIVPGSGYFYTGQYKLGVLAVTTNAALIYMIYHSYRRGKKMSTMLFSFLELSFYNYAIVGSVRGALEFNKKNSEKKNLFIGIRKEF